MGRKCKQWEILLRIGLWVFIPSVIICIVGGLLKEACFTGPGFFGVLLGFMCLYGAACLNAADL